MGEDYKKIAVMENLFEAQLLESILQEREIPHRLTSYHDTAFDGLYQAQKGWGYISSLEQYSEEIKEILSEVRNSADDGVDLESC